MMNNKKLAATIIKSIHADFNDRRGLHLDDIDSDILAEMRRKQTQIVLDLLNSKVDRSTKVCPNCNGSKLGVRGPFNHQPACSNCNGKGIINCIFCKGDGNGPQSSIDRNDDT